MSKHTPGPWGVVYKDKYGQLIVKDKHIEIATCWHHCVGEIEKEMHANARLIAAAPDLLEALSRLVEIEDGPVTALMGWPEAMDAARAAIVKATGI